MTAGRLAKAREVRTGDTITNDYARKRWMTVDYPTWDRFTNPEGQTFDRIRFTGTDRCGQHVELGYGMPPDGRVYVVADAPFDGDTYKALTGPDDEGDPWDDWLDDEWTGEAQ